MADEETNVEETPEQGLTPEGQTPETDETPEEGLTPEGQTPETEVAAETPAEEPVAEAPAVEEEAPAPPAVSQPKPKRKHVPRSERHKHSKPARERSATRKPITRVPKPESEPGRRQERRGVVVSDKADKTIVVKVEMTKAHPVYKKVVRRSQKFHAHDEQNAAGIGDVVRIIETRPLSKTKHWRLAEIVEKAK